MTFDKIRDVKLILHKNFYNDQNIDSLLMDLQSRFDLFSIEYSDVTKTIQMKIKKTTMKKIANYTHSSLFYYSIINPIMQNFLVLHAMHLPEIHTNEEYLNIIKNHHSVCVLYNIIAIGDNIINIQL